MEIFLSNVGLLRKEKYNPDLRKGKPVFLPIYFLIPFRGFIAVKICFNLELKKFSHLKLGRKGKRRMIRNKDQDFSKKNQGILSGIRGRDPYQGMLVFSCWVYKPANQSCFNAEVLEIDFMIGILDNLIESLFG